MPSQRLPIRSSIQFSLLTMSMGVLVPVFAATAQTPLQQGIASYNSGNYPAAISFLQEHVAKNSKDATAHYYLANALMKVRQIDDAAAEYRKAYESSPANSQLRQYCIVALQKLEPSANPAGGQSSGASGSSAKLNPDSEVSKTLAHIERQTSIAKQNKAASGEANASFLMGRNRFDEGKLLSERNAKINQLLQPDMVDIHGRAIYLDHSAEIEAIKRDYEERIKEAKLMAQEDAVKAKQKAAADSTKMSAELENLRNQLTDTKQLRDGAKLQAAGTNMYTRQYGDPRTVAARKPDADQDEMLASQQKMILDPHTKPGTSKTRSSKDPLVAEQDKLQESQETDLRVKGTLIRK
ncbi:MAG TPA: tetratricopeptide repeat protein [Drouetiella sp.]